MEINTANSSSELHKQLFVLKPTLKNGLIATIKCNLSGSNRFLRTAFNEVGDILAAANHNGAVYVVNFATRKFWLLKGNIYCSALAFVKGRRDEVLLALGNGDVSVVNISTGREFVLLKGHKHPVFEFSFSDTGRFLTSSNYEAIVWNFPGFHKLQILVLEKDMVLRKAMFTPSNDCILTQLSDGVLQLWDGKKFERVHQIKPSIKRFTIKSFTFTRNGEYMIIGGTTNELIVFSTSLLHTVKRIILPGNVLSVKQLECLNRPFDGGSNKILVLLSGHGHLLLYNLEDSSIVGSIVAKEKIVKFSLSPSGEKATCILRSGEMCVYNVGVHFVKEKEAVLKKSLVNFQRTTSSSSTFKTAQMLPNKKLKLILNQFGEYPSAHRKTVWSTLLDLPNDRHQFEAVMKRKYDDPFLNLEKHYPLQDRRELDNLKRVLKNIVSWCPFFADVHFLPGLVYPFVKVFRNDPVLCFEAITLILVNYCQHWFDYHPLPPLNILNLVENVMLLQDPELVQHMRNHGMNVEIIAWSLLKSAFSEVLSGEDWLILWDHVLSNEPSFLLHCTAAYSLIDRNILMSYTQRHQLEQFYTCRVTVDLKKLLTKSYTLQRKKEGNLEQYLSSFRPMKEGCYPEFEDNKLAAEATIRLEDETFQIIRN